MSSQRAHGELPAYRATLGAHERNDHPRTQRAAPRPVGAAGASSSSPSSPSSSWWRSPSAASCTSSAATSRRAVDLQDAAASITSVVDDDADAPTSEATTTARSRPPPPTGDRPRPPPPPTRPRPPRIAGTWNVDTSIGEFNYEDSTGTFVGFRIDEELSGIGSTTAVGRTPDVSGLDHDRGHDADRGDDRGRHDDDHDQRQPSRRQGAQSALETGDFPTATFVLTAPVELGDAAATGAAVDVRRPAS